MAQAVIQSAKFKKDYMMLMSFMIFFLIVAAECFLIVWLPWHLKLDGMWAEQVAQQELIDAFDGLRGGSRNAAAKLSKPAGAEAALICESMDGAAAYMHRYGKSMTPQQCKKFKDIITRLRAQFGAISAGRAYSRNVELNKTFYVRKLRGVPQPAAKKQSR